MRLVSLAAAEEVAQEADQVEEVVEESLTAFAEKSLDAATVLESVTHLESVNWPVVSVVTLQL